MAANFNVMMARKVVAHIHHRIAEQGLDAGIRRRIIDRQLADLKDTLPRVKFGGLITACKKALAAHPKYDAARFMALAIITGA